MRKALAPPVLRAMTKCMIKTGRIYTLITQTANLALKRVVKTIIIEVIMEIAQNAQLGRLRLIQGFINAFVVPEIMCGAYVNPE
jgi:predicted transcriptional regulator